MPKNGIRQAATDSDATREVSYNTHNGNCVKSLYPSAGVNQLKTLQARLIISSVFLATWVAAYWLLFWLATTYFLEAKNLQLDNVPKNFHVVIEEAGKNGNPATYRSIPYHALPRNLQLAPGESLRLGTNIYSDLDLAEAPSSCCMDFKVLDDGPNGQLIELNIDDMSYLRSRYLVRGNQVVPVSFRSDFSLYYLGYILLGGVLALLVTLGLRGRILAWSKEGR